MGIVNTSALRSKFLFSTQLIMKVVPTIAFYYFNRVTEAMKGRSTSTSRQNKRSSTSDKSDSAPSSDKDEQDSRGSKDEGESPNDAKRRRRLIEEDNHDSRDSAPPSSPDHTYKTSDDEENSDKERDCDKELNNMLPCTGTEELLSSDNDDENNVDDDVDDDFVAPGKGVQTLSRPGLNLEGLVRVRGMSAKESSTSENYQENIADRVTTYVRKHLFRVVKFISNEHMFGKAFKGVMDHECVADRDRVKFQMLYESVFNHALNSKRSTCEQAGKGIMLKELKRFGEEGIDMFSIEELQKMRRATTEREKKAFLWFYGTFLECVSGQKHWGMQKSKQLVSQASSSATKHGKLVTISDEAFALLLYDNYNGKWLKTFQREEEQRLETPEAPAPPGSGGRNKSRREREKGKYTAQKTGHCKYGGWSREGMARYNEFYHLVKADRACEQAMDMERELLTHCMALKKRGTNAVGTTQESSDGEQAEDALEPVEACWDLEL